jgi:Signal transduction histidine kinase
MAPRSQPAGVWVAALWLFCAAWCGGVLQAQAVDESPRQLAGTRVLTSFDEIWQLTQAEQQQWHRVQLEYVVYYYDPLWQAMWGRSREAESYLSLGAKVFPIKPGNRILVEGLMRPARGMRVEDAKVTVLEESVPLPAVSTQGAVGNVERFNKRRVTVEGYVDRQAARDANHLEMSLIAEGRSVLVQLLLKSDTPAPLLRDKFVRATGVYFARSEEGAGGAKIELWVQQSEDIEVFGTLDRDPRFDLPATPVEALAERPSDRLVRVAGVVVAQEPGRTLTIRDGASEVVLHTVQTLSLRAGEEVEAVGFPTLEATSWVLQQSLVRAKHPVFTSVNQIWELPDTERRKWQRVDLDVVVFYFDPHWRALWGNIGGTEDYLSLGERDFKLKPGQRIRVEGSVLVENGVVVDNPKVTVPGETVPLEPLSTAGRIRDADRFNKRMVVVEAYVDRQAASDARHLRLDLVVEGRPVIGRLLIEEGETPSNWEGNVVRLRGVYSATPEPGGATSIEIWIHGLENLEVLGTLDLDERFSLPATPIEQLGALPAGTPVRVSGVVRAQQPGRLLTLRDETGQVNVLTAQAQPTEIGGRVEAVGVVTANAAEVSLGEGLFRGARTATAARAGSLRKLRLADQLRELSPEEAERNHPVQLAGVITWARPEADFFFVRDVSGGVCVYRPPEMTQRLTVGRRVELTGVSASGRFTPVVLASTVQPLGTVELPEPRDVTLEQALTGVEEAQWVTMSGYVRAVEREGPWMRLELTTFGGEFQAMLPAGEQVEALRGAVLRMRGVCRALANEKRQLTGIQLWVPSVRFIEVEEAMPKDPFTVEERSIASLRQFGTLQGVNRRVRVAGVVVHHEPGRLVNIQGGNEGLLVLSRDTEPLQPGDRIEAVGFPGRENRRAVLREAIYRRVASGAEPEPVDVTNVGAIDVELDGRLVRVEGVLLDVAARDRGVELINQQGEEVYRAQLSLEDVEMAEQWLPGSQLVLTGVYEVSYDEYRRPHEVRLKLRTPGDVIVLKRPSWWTVKTVLALTGLLGVAVVLGFGWVLVLRRRVREQTDVIRERVENERAARLEAALARASKLESLGVLAGGIAHDFNNLLTVILGNVSLAKLDPRIDPEAVQCLAEGERAAVRARDLTQQLLTFAKGGEPMRTATRLPDVVQEATEFALHGSKVRSEFEIAPDLWAADVDKGQIGQVVHNLTINATQAMPNGGTLRVAMRNEELAEARAGLAAGRYVKVSFSDNGTGIAPELLQRIFEPYFTTKKQGSGLGLATVYSIIKKHDGHIEVTSQPGRGTTFHVWVRAAVEAASRGVGAKARASGGARVLLMDDEAPIRMLGGTVLKRMGYGVTAVSDGASVVSEYAAAAAAGRRFDLVILDLTVPGGMGGAEAMQKLRAMDPEVCAIVSSGYSSDPVMANYRAHGFRARVPKPYAASDLSAVVQAVLDERNAAPADG